MAIAQAMPASPASADTAQATPWRHRSVPDSAPAVAAPAREPITRRPRCRRPPVRRRVAALPGGFRHHRDAEVSGPRVCAAMSSMLCRSACEKTACKRGQPASFFRQRDGQGRPARRRTHRGEVGQVTASDLWPMPAGCPAVKVTASSSISDDTASCIRRRRQQRTVVTHASTASGCRVKYWR